MVRTSLRFFATFLSGVTAAVVAIGLVGGPASLASTRYEDLQLFSSVLNLVRSNYVDEVDEHKLLRGAVAGMLNELDPHSAYMDVDAYKEMQIDTRGEFHGLGIEITKDQGGFVEVVAPIDGTPADRAGIQARDQIVTICPTEPPESWTEECRTTKNMTLFEAVKLMRGRKGTEITIHVFREGFDRPRPFKVVRDVVHVESVDGRMLDDGYGYVRIRAFQERTADDLTEVLEALRAGSEDSLRGLVLDLRDNPGGLLDQAVKVADLWLGDGLIVYTQGRDESQRQEYRAHGDSTDAGYPMVVVVNEGSASASEIVAGALQDQNRALVLGTGTFGKGSVQTVYPLEDGSGLRLTTARYYTPVGRSIQEVGIEPDIEVGAGTRRDDPEAQRRLRERDLEGHLEHEGEGEDGGDAGDAPEPSAAAEDGDGDEPDEDLQLVRALEVLKSWTYFEKLRERRDDEKPVRSARAAGEEAAPRP